MKPGNRGKPGAHRPSARPSAGPAVAAKAVAKGRATTAPPDRREVKRDALQQLIANCAYMLYEREGAPKDKLAEDKARWKRAEDMVFASGIIIVD